MPDQARIRNFSIIAHVDHGKSTLADRFLEITGTVLKKDIVEQTLDSHPVSRERGITIRLAPVTMAWSLDSVPYTLNLIDTPGHVDFSYEVERSLAACEGAILLVDATQGVQAQTIAHFRRARNLGLKIIPVINKIDLPGAKVEETEREIEELFTNAGDASRGAPSGDAIPSAVEGDHPMGLSSGRTRSQILRISAKTGQGVPELLEAVINQVSPPAGNPDNPTKTLIFSSQYHRERGVVAFVKVLEGKLSGDVGHFTPAMTPAPFLATGEVGYLLTGIKDPEKVPLWEGYHPPKPMVFISFFPVDPNDYPLLEDALKKLKLNDAAITFTPASSKILGRGFRCGFLGHLHAEVSQERLERDFNLSLIATPPTVEYKIPSIKSQIPNSYEEPWITATIIAPQAYLGAIITLCENARGKLVSLNYPGESVVLIYELPLSEIITDFFDRLKSQSSGFASLDYDFLEYRPFNAVTLEVLINHELVDAFTQIMEKTRADRFGKFLAGRLKEVIPRQQIPVVIQIVVDGQIIAREDIAAFRKDVTAKLYGGDRTRKDKLRDAQKKGKKKMAKIGKIELPGDVFLRIFKT